MFADRVARIPVRETGEYRNARADRPRPERAAGPGAIMWCLDTRPGRARSCTNWRTSSSSALRSADQPLRASRPAPSSIKRYVEHYVENKVRDQKIFGGVPAARPHDKTLAQKAEAAVTPPLRPNAQGGIDLSPPSNVTSREDYDRVLVPHAPAKGQSVTTPQIPLDLTPAAPPVSSYKYNGGPHESYEAGAAIDFTITPPKDSGAKRLVLVAEADRQALEPLAATSLESASTTSIHWPAPRKPGKYLIRVDTGNGTFDARGERVIEVPSHAK